MGTTPVLLETGRKRVFASALDWPGWARAGRDEESSLAALADYRERYAEVAAHASVTFRPGALEVVERLPGDATTDFGAPSAIAAHDATPLPAAAAHGQVALLRAAWAELDRRAAEAPEVLRKGPRGGGRDRDAVVAHVVEAERAYARSIGVRHPPFDPADKDALAGFRAELAAALDRGHDGAPMAGKRWPARYALRRIVWHVLDHVWEIEDRSG